MRQPRFSWSARVSFGRAHCGCSDVAFSLYVNFFGITQELRALAVWIVLMLWLNLTCYTVLLGAEINSES